MITMMMIGLDPNPDEVHLQLIAAYELNHRDKLKTK